MDIQLSADQPFMFCPYWMAQSEQSALKNIIDDLLANGIICESSSDYCSPVLLVKKKCGEWRMCIDYRKLNSLTVQTNFPLPRIDEQIDHLQCGAVFSCLDMKSGYHQVPLEERVKRFASFTTPFGQFELNRVGFGLTNAPQFVQKFMSSLLRSVSIFASVYIDDILVHSTTPEEALNHLESVLKIMRAENLTLSLRKCQFLVETVAFLGFEISNGQVRPGIDKTAAVQQFPVPKSVHNVRQFLCLTGFFRHFVPRYAQIAKPLTELTKKTTQWKWTAVEDAAFCKLQSILIERPVLQIVKLKYILMRVHWV